MTVTNDGTDLRRIKHEVYLDLYFLFTKWDRIWGAVKQNLQRRPEVSFLKPNANVSGENVDIAYNRRFILDKQFC
jgi:hypothetical protein